MPQDSSHFATCPEGPRVARGWLLAVVPSVLAVTIISLAPNWDATVQSRSDPYGGDFLQEWVGGRAIVTGNADELYDLDASRRRQHDAVTLGFQWDTQRYFPVVYPPFWYFLCAPLAMLPYQAAAIIWLLLMTASLVAALWLLRKLFPDAWWLPVFCISYPVIISLTTGQKGTLLLLILTATFWLLKTQRHLAAGAIFALIAFKPHLALLIGLFMLLKRQWSFVAGCGVTLAIQLGLCGLLGMDVCRQFVDVCLGMGNYMESGGYQLEQGFSLWSACQLLFASPLVAKWAAAIATLGIVAGVFSLLLGKLEPAGERFPIQFSAMVLGTILVSPHFYVYDLTVLMLPTVLVSLQLGKGGVDRPLVLGLPLCLVLLMFATGQMIWVATATGVSLGVWVTLVAFGLSLARCRAGNPAYGTVASRSLRPC